jgi:hypothetical protein
VAEQAENQVNTITYNEMLYRAAEAAGRTRDKIPVSESALLKSVFAVELLQVWTSSDWNALIPEPLAVTVSDRKFANPYTDAQAVTTTFGDILGVYAANPRTSTKARPLDWYQSDGYIHLAPDGQAIGDGGVVYVEYMLPPTDLLAVAAADLGATQIPRFLANYLAERGAAQLLVADGMTALAGVHFGLAKEALAFETDNITRPWWRRQIRYRNA